MSSFWFSSNILSCHQIWVFPAKPTKNIPFLEVKTCVPVKTKEKHHVSQMFDIVGSTHTSELEMISAELTKTFVETCYIL
jgi:hypothetical protein